MANINDTKKQLNYKDWADPSRVETQLALWFYTIEPPFYEELNKASRDMAWEDDPTIIDTLGPLAFALLYAVDGAESKIATNPIPGPSCHRAWQ